MKIKISESVVNEHLVLSDPMEGPVPGVSPEVEALLTEAHRLFCEASDLAAQSPRASDAQAIINELAHAYNILRYTLKAGRRNQLAARIVKNIPAFEAFWSFQDDAPRAVGTSARKKTASKKSRK